MNRDRIHVTFDGRLIKLAYLNAEKPTFRCLKYGDTKLKRS